MMKIYHFFRLIRFANLLVIGLTMVVVEVFLLKYKLVQFQNPVFNDYSVYNLVNSSGVQANQVSGFSMGEWSSFFILILSTLLIAAAGNIINDYFDVKADRVNKPARLIIGKYIKRRWAMVLHWSFNSLGIILALYVGYVLQNIWVPLIAFLSINLLWFYSAYYKRKPFIGNLIVALLIGVLPVYVLIFNWPLSDFSIQFHNTSYEVSKQYFLVIILFVSVLAFLQNLVRELMKDIQDIRGDLKLGAKTFPIKYGIKRTKWLLSLFAIIIVLIMPFFYVYVWNFDFNMKGATMGNGIDLNEIMSFDIGNFALLLLFSLVTFLTSFVLIIFFNKSKTYKIASTLLKVAMLFGLLTPLFL